MKTKLLIICYAFTLLFACSSEDDVPEGIIPPDKMAALYLDMYIAEGKVNNLRISRDSSMSIFSVYEDSLFAQHQVKDSVYRTSISYYYDNPEKLEKIYSKVLDSLNLMQERLKEVKPETEKNKLEAK